MSAFRQGTGLMMAVAAVGLLLSGCAIGVSAGANVSVTDRQHVDKGPTGPVHDPYQSASTVAAESAVAVSHPH